jgi:flagellin
MTSAPATGGDTYTFSTDGGNSLTLTGPDGVSTIGVGNIAANGTETLTFGNIGFTLTAGANGMTAAAIVASLTQPANDTIVVSSTGSAGAPRTLTTAASTGATFQIGANEGDTLGVSFANAQTSAYAGFDTAVTNFTAGLNSATAGALITATDTAIADVSSIRGGYGAVENRLTHTVSSISVASENLNASESRIKDLDVVSEMVNFTKTQILQQAGTSILAQANSAPQMILTLLR